MAREYSITIYHDQPKLISPGHFYGKLEGPGQEQFFGKEKVGIPFVADTNPQLSETRHTSSSQNPSANKFVEAKIFLSKEQFENALSYLQSNSGKKELYILSRYDCIQYVQRIYEKAGQVGEFRTLFEKHVRQNSPAMRTTFNVLGEQSTITKKAMSVLPTTTVYKVKEGDTIQHIAESCGTTTDALLEKNPSVKASCIYQSGQCLAAFAQGQHLVLPDDAKPDLSNLQISVINTNLKSSHQRIFAGGISEDTLSPNLKAYEELHKAELAKEDQGIITALIEGFAKTAENIAEHLPKDLKQLLPEIKAQAKIVGKAATVISGFTNYGEAKEQHKEHPMIVAVVQTAIGNVAWELGGLAGVSVVAGASIALAVEVPIIVTSIATIGTGLVAYYTYHHTLHKKIGDYADEIMKRAEKIFQSHPKSKTIILNGPQDLDLLFTRSGELFPIRHKGNTIITGQPIKSQTDVESFCTKCTPKLTYTVKKGDTLWDVAKGLDVSIKELLDMPGNEKIRDSYRSVGNGKFHAHLEIGQQLHVPAHSKTNSNGKPGFTQCNQHSPVMPPLDIFVEPLHSSFIPPFLSDLEFTNYGGALAQGLNELWTPSSVKHASTSNTPSILDIKVGDFSRNNAQDMQTSHIHGLAKGGPHHEIRMPVNILNGDGIFNFAPSSIVTDYWRPGAFVLSSVNPLADLRRAIYSDPPPQNQNLVGHQLRQVQNMLRGAATYQNIDPIVINLDGGGVNFIELEKSFVLFDVDNDGYLENTAWIKRGSAFLVIDKNGNRKLDDVTELAGEHYFDDPRLNTSALVHPMQKKFSMRKYQKHAFQMLQLYDFNGDKILNSTDGIFSELLLWHDKNEDGVCEDAEMHTLAEYKITSIDLKYQPNKDLRQSQIQYISNSFTTSGHTMLTYAIAFKANKEGDMLSDVPLGHILRSESGLASLKLNKAATVFIKNHSVQNIHGSDEDDELHGDEKENWFIGGKGKDKMFLGNGNDICVIDAEDDPQDIDGGGGFNIAYATGDTGIAFIMYPSRINQTYGTEFADFIAVGNQNKTTSGGFIESGAGDDLVIGDDASDALSGGDDDDHVKGMGGNDLVRGDRGDDLLELGTGDDIGEGGDGDDIIFGEEGDDSLKGDRGNDKLHGGPGTDFAEYVGSFDEYRIEKANEGHYIIQDLHPNRDGRDELFDIEKLVFSSAGGSYTVTLDKLFEGYQDFIPLNELGPTIIKPEQLLLNDINFSGEEIYICEVHDTQNGQMTTTKVGDKITQIQFTSTVIYQTIKQFGYTLCTSSAKDSVLETYTNRSATHYIKVYLTESYHPKDELFYGQWYLTYTNVIPVWQFYSGKNITVLVNEGSADHTHIDLRDNLKFHESRSDKFAVHATTVAGIIAASRNNIGIVGIAYNAVLGSEEGVSVAHAKYDVIDRSWGWSRAQPFLANFSEAQEVHITKTGRHGLGTIIAQSAGNERHNKDNTNDFQQTNSLYSIVVGAIYKDASLSYIESNVEAFSNRGASVLISAPGSHITTSSALTENNNGNVFTWDYDMVKGTSFSAPIVAGIVALMLEANPYLGYRDVERILATTARKINDPTTEWNKNADLSLNFEGRHYSHDYGFGCVNAFDAVKFAEFWPYLRAQHNIERVSANSTFGIKAIAPQTTFSWPLEISANFIVQNVVLEYEISHKNFSSVVINLISPSGTKSYLKEENSRNVTSTRLRFRALSKHFMGENSKGLWTYEIINRHQMQLGFLNSANLTIYGDLYTTSVAMITSEITASHAIESAMVLAPSLQDNLQVELNRGSSFLYSGLSFQFKTMPINFVSGSGYDVITGNQLDNVIYTNDGNDKSYGNGGNDLLVGGRGSNWYSGGPGADVFVIHFDPNNIDIISDFSSEDFVIFVGFPSKIDTRYKTLMNSKNAFLVNHFHYHTFFKINESTHYHSVTTNINQLIIGGKTKDILHGSNAHDLIIGNGGDDILLGWAADDILICGNGNCLAYGHEGNDELRSGHGINKLFGGPGNDIFVPDAGAIDLLFDFNPLEDKIKAAKPKITSGTCLAEYKLPVADCTYIKSAAWQIVLPGTNLNLENVFIS